MGARELKAVGEFEIPFKPYGASTDGDANAGLPLVDIEQLRAEMDTEGYGTNAMDPQTGEPIDRPMQKFPVEGSHEERG